MSSGNTQIICRSCGEKFPQSSGSCPHCGTSIRGSIGPIAAIVLGLILVVSSLFRIGDLWFFALIGLALVGFGGMMLQDKRRRIREANQEESTA